MKINQISKSKIKETAAGRITAQNTTVDVKPGETKRQAAKFGNKVNSKNEPPMLHAKARKNSDPHTLSNLGLAEAASGPVIGYKIMNYDPETNELVSGADSRIRKQLSKGMTLQMSRLGIFMSTNPEYVQTYYGGHNDVEVMLTLQFNADEITSGNLTDKENEFTVPRAKVVDYKIINHMTEAAEIKKPDPKDTLGVKRADMPQVHRDHYPELIKYLASHGNKFTTQEVDASDLKPVQSEFSDEGVRGMMKTRGVPSDSTKKGKKPLIVSADNYIIDGHHRWLAAYNLGDAVPIMRGTLPIKKMFQLVKEFRHTTYKDITESTQLNELFNNVHDWKWGYRPDVALFTSEDGGEVVVSFSKLQKDSPNYEVNFSKNGNIKRSGEGDQFKIIATVIEIIKDFISKNPQLNLLTFTAKREGRELESPKHKNARASLYKRMLGRFAEQHGFEFHTDDIGRMTEFYVVKKDTQTEKYSMMEWACIEGGHDLNDLNDLYENMSVTGTSLSKQDRKRNLQPGTDAWFKHWFSRPYLKREDVDRLKEEAAQAIKENKHAKKDRRRKAKGN